jgi:hypothetical protein
MSGIGCGKLSISFPTYSICDHLVGNRLSNQNFVLFPAQSHQEEEVQEEEQQEGSAATR